MAVSEWSIEGFSPSCDAGDHIAWLEGINSSRQPVHMKVQFGSRGVSQEDAKTIVNRIVMALNDRVLL